MASVFSFLNYYMTFEFDFIQTFPFSFKYHSPTSDLLK